MVIDLQEIPYDTVFALKVSYMLFAEQGFGRSSNSSRLLCISHYYTLQMMPLGH